MVKFDDLFEVGTEFLNIIYASFGFKGLMPMVNAHGFTE
jgi:hypothetical protein